MFTRKNIGVGRLILNIQNFRIVAQASQKAARDAIIAEQGRKLSVLAKDIIENGLSPFDLPMVIDAEDGNGSFIMMEGNRRLVAIKLLLDPELARGSPIYRTFSKLHRDHEDAIPKAIDCTIAPNREAAIMWGNRKHASGLSGAGTEPWTAMAKARAEKEQGLPSPALDIIDLVLENEKLDSEVRHELEGSRFNITTLTRLITTRALQKEIGLSIAEGKVRFSKSKPWTKKVLTDVVTIIATKEKDGKKWTERAVDTEDKRKAFAEEISATHEAGKEVSPWIISRPTRKRRRRTPTPSTHRQTCLISKEFDIATLPAGKINDVFIELKNLNVNKYRHAVSVLIRVFFEFTLDDYIKRESIELSTGRGDNTMVPLKKKLELVIRQVESTELLTKKELHSVKVTLGDNHSWLSPHTMNAYVHSPHMHPEPQTLKSEWANIQLLIKKLWETG